jgi:hypothetical protein
LNFDAMPYQAVVSAMAEDCFPELAVGWLSFRAVGMPLVGGVVVEQVCQKVNQLHVRRRLCPPMILRSDIPDSDPENNHSQPACPTGTLRAAICR